MQNRRERAASALLFCSSAVLASVSLSASAETLSALAGFTATDGRASSSYGWQLDFEQPWSERLSGSLSWLNEGHIPGHSRDGAATQFWIGAPAWQGAIHLSLGAGPYLYFDTQTSTSARARQARALGLDYRFEFSDWLAVSATWFDDPASPGGRHDRIASQLWLNDELAGGSLALSAGLGVYIELGPPPAGATTGRDEVSGLCALRAQWRATHRSSVILTWYRTFTNDDTDRDIITLGYGFRFGGS